MTSTTLKSTTPRDYSTTFGDLSSTYGFTGTSPSPIPSSTRSFSLPKFLRRRHSSKRSGAVPPPLTPSDSTMSLISRSSSDSDRTLTSSVTSTSTSTKGKDYEHAFGMLSSSYGFGSSIVPSSTVPSKSSK